MKKQTIKDIILIICLTIGVCGMLGLFGCSISSKIERTSKRIYGHKITIDSCEYLIYRETIIHKANCSNHSKK